MKNLTRIIVTTILGIISGLICKTLAASGPQILADAVAWQIIFSRSLLGFALGISAFNFGGWALRGTILGAMFSLPLAFSSMMGAGMNDMSSAQLFFGSIIMGIIYGFLIELIASVILKLKPENSK